MNFLHPHFLWLLLLIPLLITYYIFTQHKRYASLTLSSFNYIKGGSWKTYGRHICFALEMLALSCLVIAFARPQNHSSWQKDSIEGIDIMLAIDASGSMRAMDLEPNRFTAAVNVAQSFISKRPNDNIGLVLFAGESFTQCPLTTDHPTLLKRLSESSMGILEEGTAIGLGIATACNRLKTSKSKSRIIILLTDGTNNRGSITPTMAASIASSLGIRIYTIAVGKHGEAPYPVQTAFGIVKDYIKVEIDEDSLKEIAKTTDGKFFRATDNKSLSNIYKEIDQLEKTRLMTNKFHAYEELYTIWALLALIFLSLGFVLRNSIFRINP